MANLSRIQNRFDQLSSLIQEVEASQEVATLERLKTVLLIWKSETDAVLDQEFPNYTPEVDDFRRRWNRSMAGGNTKNDILKKLRNVRTNLRLILQADVPRHASLIGHPFLTSPLQTTQKHSKVYSNMPPLWIRP